MLHGEERREFQRLTLDPPVAATLADTAVLLIEIGVLGARVRHERELRGGGCELRFQHEKADVSLRCEIVRTFDSRSGAALESGIRFVAAVGESGDRLRAMLAQLVNKALEGRRLLGAAAQEQAIDGDRTIRGKDASFICYRLENGVWQKRAVFLPEQPAIGFTVTRTVASDEVQRLQRVYQASDDEGRRLIRTFAELSVSEALEIPPRV